MQLANPDLREGENKAFFLRDKKYGVAYEGFALQDLYPHAVVEVRFPGRVGELHCCMRPLPGTTIPGLRCSRMQKPLRPFPLVSAGRKCRGSPPWGCSAGSARC